MPDARVVFRVPQRFSGDLHDILVKYAAWILKRQDYFKAHPRPIALAPTGNRGGLKQHRAEALEKITASIRRFQPFIGICPQKISIRNQKTRWGSCSRRHHLSFNWRLVLLPPEILDYVVVHELCHLLHLNHSREFWKKVESILPDYLEKRRWLKKKSPQPNKTENF
ncbi:MAG: M48 family metallopeptidase [Deltaproteobacteria bacterium]|nr:M48 family metallopeptidase [Deltaproteobacteria bacterium]